jgi:hypothetical protein
VSDLPVALPGPLAEELARVADVEGKIPRAIDAVTPLDGRDVIVVGHADGRRARELREHGARVSPVADVAETRAHAENSADVVVGFWDAFRLPLPSELEAADRVLRPGGRIIAVHDYGRDDVSRLRGEQPEYGSWSRRDGPFLTAGFRIHVVHCWWTFESLEGAARFLGEAFGAAGETVAASLRRPRLSWNVAIYHRRGGGEAAA